MSRAFDALSALELRALIVARHISPVELVQRALQRIEETEPHINAFAHVDATSALIAAREAERKVLAGEPLGLLHGLPVSVKDLLAVAHMPWRFGSWTEGDRVATFDCPAVERIRAQGGCILGKTTTSEFGCKAVGDSPRHGATRNPWDLSRTAGGSSAGAAASVACGVSALALGTDGGGSVRIPAAMNRLVGFKPSLGRVPFFPAAATPSLAHIGPLTRTVRDAALLLQAVSGFDPRDPHSLSDPVPDFLKACERPLGRLRIAWSPTLGYAKVDPRVLAVAERAAKVFNALGCEVEEVSWTLPDPHPLWAEAFYGGVAQRLRDAMTTCPDRLDPAVLPFLQAASRQSPVGGEVLAQRRAGVDQALTSLFAQYDLLLTPTLPISAPPVGPSIPEGHEDRDPIGWSYYTYPFNLTGQPAVSIPAGQTVEGLAVGLQLIAPMHHEALLFSAAAAFEQAQPWARELPLAHL
ncbi:amidase family protein [Pseudomonas sp. RC10]|uniref:amidase n=1 Tax=Pseudomonas bambusae TaxID=3139142 RepID=UPI0031397FBC